MSLSPIIMREILTVNENLTCNLKSENHLTRHTNQTTNYDTE